MAYLSMFWSVLVFYALDVCSGISPDYTLVPPASSIIDLSNNSWTLSNGYIYVNGNQLSGSYNVNMLVWIGGLVYQLTSSDSWYNYINSAWSSVSNPFGTSTDTTLVPPALYIIDSSLNLWALSSDGYIYKNGIKDSSSYNVALLVWNNGSLYQENTSGYFFKYTGTSWTSVTYPLGSVSSDKTIITSPLTYITDSSNNIWSLDLYGYIYKNGVQDSNSYNVMALLWYGSTLYQENTSGHFYKYVGGSTGWTSTSDPRQISAENTTVSNSASYIIDGNWNNWTLDSAGYIYKNGIRDPNAFGTTMLLYYGQSAGYPYNYVWCLNNQGMFYRYQGPNYGANANANWTGFLYVPQSNAYKDPRLISADGTIIPTAAYIFDKTANNWTLSNGYVYRNGAQDTTFSSVTSILYYGGLIWQLNHGQWYVYTLNYTWLKASDPRTSVAAKSGIFYGMNGHYDYGMWPIYDTPDQIVAVLQDLGVTNYRISLTNSSGLSIGISTAQALQKARINFLVAVTYGISDGASLFYTDEQSAYNGIRPGAAALAKALAPYGVTTFEAGNELTRDPFIIVNSAYAGTTPTDFNNTNWPIMRGAIRGMIDGIKSVNSTFRVGVNFCVADVAAADMLWEGVQPDGSTTYSNGTSYPKIKWDITTWHNYGAYGDLFDIYTDGSFTSFNLPVYAKARYGVPFWITEWNSFNAPSYTEAQRSVYVQQQLTEFYNNRKTNAIESSMFFELRRVADFPGIATTYLLPTNPTYNTFKSFTQNNPDN